MCARSALANVTARYRTRARTIGKAGSALVLAILGFSLASTVFADMMFQVEFSSFGQLSQSPSTNPLSPWIGMMYSSGDYWVAKGVDFVRPYLEKAEQLHCKVWHIQVMRRSGEFYVPEEVWTEQHGAAFSKSLVRSLIQLGHEHGMKVIEYINTWCESSLASSKYADCILSPSFSGYDGPVMDLDPDKSYGRDILEQMRNAMDDWGFDGFEIDGIAVEGDPLDMYSQGFLDFLRQAKAECNARGKALMGNPPRGSGVSPYLDFAYNAMDAGGYNLNDASAGGRTSYHGPWYDYLRNYCRFADNQLQYHSWEPRPGYVTTPLTREEWETFLQWCLEGKVLAAPRWDDFMIDSMWSNKDLFDTYMPQIEAAINAMIGG